MNFDTRVKDTYRKKKNAEKLYYKNEASLASGINTLFFPEKANEFCDRLRIIIRKKRNDTKVDDAIFTKYD